MINSPTDIVSNISNLIANKSHICVLSAMVAYWLCLAADPKDGLDPGRGIRIFDGGENTRDPCDVCYQCRTLAGQTFWS